VPVLFENEETEKDEDEPQGQGDRQTNGEILRFAQNESLEKWWA
jgi:hypothetical protein